MKKSVLTIVAAITLISISNVSFAEDSGACYMQCVYIDHPNSVQEKCINNYTHRECQEEVNDLNQARTDGSGLFKYISQFMGRWERNQPCKR